MIQKLKQKVWFKWLTNKYVFSSVLFCVWMLFLDTHAYVIQRSLSNEIDALNDNIEFYDTELQSMRTELEELESNPKAFEKYAREKFWMHRKGEHIVLIDVSEED